MKRVCIANIIISIIVITITGLLFRNKQNMSNGMEDTDIYIKDSY